MAYLTEKVLRISPYTPGEQPPDGERLIKLNTNENPYPPSPEVLASIRQGRHEDLRLYPDPDSSRLRDAIAAWTGVQSEQVFCANGSDEALAFCYQAFFSPGRPLLFADVTYSFYQVFAQLYDVAYQTVPLDEDWQVDMGGYLRENAGIIIANPNAPTGVLMAPEAIERLLQHNLGQAVVIVDEAYIAFGGQSVLPLVGRYPNLLVVRTFSKSHSLAGQRVGFCVGSAELIDGLNRVKNCFNSYTLDRIASASAIAAIQSDEYYVGTAAKIMATRDWFVDRMRGRGFVIPESKANFVFMHHPEAAATDLLSHLRRNGILVRHFDQPRVHGHLRVTIGTDPDMAALAECIESYLG